MKKITQSFCPICYKVIPAVIEPVAGQAVMIKNCQKHGVFQAVVEADYGWWEWCQKNKTDNIYDGYFIDVTSNCNMKCAICFHDNTGLDRTVDDIVQEALDHSDKGPFILTGGEPIVHPRLPEIVSRINSFGNVHVLTNGVNMTSKLMFKLLKAGVEHNGEGVVGISLSYHPESHDACIRMLQMCREMGVKIWSVLVVITELEQMKDALTFYAEYCDVVNSLRIKAVCSELWKTAKINKPHIFISDMIQYMRRFGNVQINVAEGLHNKVSYVNTLMDGMRVELVSWYDVNNVDLWDVDCPPYYRANDGSVNNLIITCIINEGMGKKVGVNIRRAVVNDLPEVAMLWAEMAVEEQPGCKPDKGIWAAQTEQFLKDTDHNHLYVSELDGVIVGFVQGLWILNPVTGERDIIGIHFYVKPQYRKTEVAVKLHSTYKETARGLGVKRVIRQTTETNAEHLKKKGQKVTAIIVEEEIK